MVTKSKGFPFRRRVLWGMCQDPGVKTDPEPGRAAPAERNRWVATRDEPEQRPQVWGRQGDRETRGQGTIREDLGPVQTAGTGTRASGSRGCVCVAEGGRGEEVSVPPVLSEGNPCLWNRREGEWGRRGRQLSSSGQCAPR